jgi:hypothetical protein
MKVSRTPAQLDADLKAMSPMEFYPELSDEEISIFAWSSVRKAGPQLCPFDALNLTETLEVRFRQVRVFFALDAKREGDRLPKEVK